VRPDLLRAAAMIARKDLTIEFRTKTAFFAASAFTLLAIVIFFFAWDPTAVSAIDLAPGVLWVIFTFSGLLGLQRSFNVEHADRAMDALLAAPIARESIYLGKAAANLVFVLAVQVLAIPAVALFYNAPMGHAAGGLALIAVLAAIGLVAVGTLFSSIASNTRLAELLLPVVVLPFFVPIVMAAAQSTGRIMAGRPLAESASWLQLLAGYDLVFAAACMLAFPYTLEE
jgi:heme exporter protein B